MESDRATRAIESERAHIGHEIHDALLPLIFAASASLQSYLDDPADQPDRQRLDQALTWLDDAMQTGRKLLSQVYPPELSRTNWTAAAKDTATRLIDPWVDIDWQFDSASHDYPIALATAAYRIVIEAVRNAVRHGKATEVSVTATAHQVTITDNGSGFEPDCVSADRYGIRSMKGRAALVGGQLQIESKIGGPTKVQFDFDSR